jgi:hypothetical protein
MKIHSTSQAKRTTNINQKRPTGQLSPCWASSKSCERTSLSLYFIQGLTKGVSEHHRLARNRLNKQPSTEKFSASPEALIQGLGCRKLSVSPEASDRSLGLPMILRLARGGLYRQGACGQFPVPSEAPEPGLGQEPIRPRLTRAAFSASTDVTSYQLHLLEIHYSGSCVSQQYGGMARRDKGQVTTTPPRRDEAGVTGHCTA